MFAGGKVRGEAEFNALGEGLSPYPYALVVEQGEHERLLYEHINRTGKTLPGKPSLSMFHKPMRG